jgi:parvulin-like peptidyl-prolyl isomerase
MMRTWNEWLCLFSVLLIGTVDLMAQAEVRTPPPEPPAPRSARGTEAIQAPGGIAALVGDDVITQAELDKQLEQMRLQLSSQYPTSAVQREMARLSSRVLDRMIDDRLVLQLVRKEEKKNENKPFIAESDIDGYIQRQLKDLRKENSAVQVVDDLYRMVEERDGMNRKEYRKLLREKLAVGAYIRANVMTSPDSFVAPEEAKAYYRAHLGEFTEPVEVAFRQILIKQARSNDSAARVAVVEQGLKEGIPFVELAQKYSDEVVEGKPEDAGKVRRKSFEDLKTWREPIPQVLRSLGKGEVSGRVVTVLGVHYFQIDDLVPGKPKSFGEVQESINERIRSERNQAELDAFFQKLRRRIHVEVFLPKAPRVERAEATSGTGKKEDGKKDNAPTGGK